MMLKNKILSALGSGGKPLYVDDVFSTYLYNGNGATQTIHNRIDLAGKGGMVWTKARSNGTYTHSLIDTVRGLDKSLTTSGSDSQYTNSDRITAISSTGFSVGASFYHNQSSQAYASWTFRKAPKFFDVVTYTGDGVASRQIPHSLGIAPGMVIVKCTSTSSNWAVYHRSFTNAAYYAKLNLTDTPASDGTVWNSTTPTDSVFTVGTSALTNTNGATYVAYLFAHDASADGIVQCGSFTSELVTLGWEPQYLLFKRADSTGSWTILDTQRMWTQETISNTCDLYANLASTESPPNTNIKPATIGFDATVLTGTYIYLAIRRSNKPPTVGTDVFMPTVYTGTNTVNRFLNTGILTDMVWLRSRAGSGSGYEGFLVGDRLRGNAYLKTGNPEAEIAYYNGLDSQVVSYLEYGNTFSSNSGIYIGNNTGAAAGYANINASTTASGHVALAFKRAVEVFDVVCYTGTGGTAAKSHNLGVVPELMIVKIKSTTDAPYVFFGNPTESLALDTNAAKDVGVGIFGNTPPTATQFTVGLTLNTSAATYIAYLFATKPGISKVGTYTGDGGMKTIDCGFTTGARFVLIKRTDIAGNWYVFDSARGILAGYDPYLSPNTRAAEVTTDDSIDPAASGFVVNQVAATNLNVSAGTYIFLALA